MRSNLIHKLHNQYRVVAVAIIVIATPFYNIASARAQSSDASTTREVNKSTDLSEWFTQPEPYIQFHWNAEVNLHANYLWRGMVCGGLSLQPEVSLGFEGFRASMWWNVGAASWAMDQLSPEVDLSLSYSRWGVTFTMIEMYYFDRYRDGSHSRFFDYNNYEPGGGGVTTELRLKYRVSDRLPLSLMWCTRFSGRDGYLTTDQTLKRAYSTYIELGYDFSLPWQLMLETRLGVTPWKSLYTQYKGNFALVNINAKLKRSWQIGQHADLQGYVEVMLNTYDINRSNVFCKVEDAANQRLNLNAGIGVRFK